MAPQASGLNLKPEKQNISSPPAPAAEEAKRLRDEALEYLQLYVQLASAAAAAGELPDHIDQGLVGFRVSVLRF
jgi:hypothetical protein